MKTATEGNDPTIARLAGELEPVQRLYSEASAFILWLVPAFLTVTGIVTLIDRRTDLSTVMNTAGFWLEGLGVAGFSLVAARLAIASSVPGQKPGFQKWLLGCFAALWLIALLVTEGTPDPLSQTTTSCGYLIPSLGILSAAILTWIVRRGAPTRPLWTGFLIASASATLTSFGFQWICHEASPTHYLIWHFGVTLLMSTAGILLGSRTLRW